MALGTAFRAETKGERAGGRDFRGYLAVPSGGAEMGMSLSKVVLKEQLVRALEADLELRERAHRSAAAAATHDEAKPENDKDTRALEQSYLARGEARRVEELRAGIADIEAMVLRDLSPGERAVLGALVTTREGDADSFVWIAPYGGGSRLASGSVSVVTPASPLGRAIVGKREGDVIEIDVAGRRREMTILSVS